MAEKTIVARVDSRHESGLFPTDPRIVIDDLCIGKKESYFTYNKSISSTVVAGATLVSGGGTGGGSYHTFDIGISVRNVSDISMRVQLTVTRQDSDGYVTESLYAYDDVSAGEHRRLWITTSVGNQREFEKYIVKEIALAPTPAGGRSEQAVWSSFTSPGKSVFAMFGLRHRPLTAKSGHPVFWFIILCLVGALAYIYFWKGEPSSVSDIYRSASQKILPSQTKVSSVTLGNISKVGYEYEIMTPQGACLYSADQNRLKTEFCFPQGSIVHGFAAATAFDSPDEAGKWVQVFALTSPKPTPFAFRIDDLRATGRN